MDCKPLDYQDLGFSSLFTDYCKEEPSIHEFYGGGSPFRLDSYKNRIKNRATFPRVPADRLSDLLMQFNAPFNPSASTIGNILKLKEADTFTVVTGQQLCLFGGPSYTLYKTLTVIALSRYLTQKTGKMVIPVFWLADEDHDYDEIRYSTLPGKNTSQSRLYLESTPVKPYSAGRLMLDEELQLLKDQLHRSFEGNQVSQYKALIKLLKDWTPGTEWRTAFGRMMMRVFGKYGLVLAGSDDSSIKEAVAPVLEEALRTPDAIYDRLKNQTSKLAENYRGQAAVGESQLFWHDDDEGRTKLDYSNGKWMLPGKASPLEKDEAAEYVKSLNLWKHLSPNVFLRPVIQEFLLPNLAYAGGGAEVGYHAQMGTLFDHFGLQMPILVPRLSATLVEPSVKKAMDSAGFTLTEYRTPVRELQSRWAGSQSGLKPNKLFEKWKKELEDSFERYTMEFKELEGTLEKSSVSTRIRMEKELDTLRLKVIRAVKKQEDVYMKRISRVGNALFPNGVLQEREAGFIYYLSEQGDAFTDELLACMEADPLETIRSHQIIYL